MIPLMAKLILLSGLGANRLLLEPQRHYFDQQLFTPDWPAPIKTEVEGGKPVPESLRDYGRRWADRWMQTVLAKPEARKEFWIGGVAFGGQVALEAAGRLLEEGCGPKGVFLIASCRTSTSVPWQAKLQATVLGMLGDKSVAGLFKKVCDHIVKKEGLSELDERLLRRITESADPSHLRWGKQAIARWRYGDEDWRGLKAAGVAIHQIHGDGDWVIPLHKGHPDKVIHGGKHLINITHKDEVNQYIESRMKSDVAEDEDV